MIKCLDNIVFSLQVSGGISVYWSEILKQLSMESAYKIYEMPNHNIFREQLTYSSVIESHLPVSLVRYLPFIQRLPTSSIFHSSYYRYSLQRNVANITTVHDFTYEYYVSGIRKKVHSLQKRLATKNSAGIICVSENTRRDLLKFYPDTDPVKIRVIYNGVTEDFRPIKLDIDDPNACLEINNKPFFLFVGDRSIYKNFDKAIGVVERFSGMALVIVGGKPISSEEMTLLKPLQGRFITCKGISVKQLNWLYNKAFCLLYPSSYEGFGLPVLEAMKAGCPVVSTNFSSIPEVAGEAGLLVDQISIESLCNKVNLLFNADFRHEIIQRGFKQASLFSWDKCFAETIQFYQDVWDRKFGG